MYHVFFILLMKVNSNVFGNNNEFASKMISRLLPSVRVYARKQRNFEAIHGYASSTQIVDLCMSRQRLYSPATLQYNVKGISNLLLVRNDKT